MRKVEVYQLADGSTHESYGDAQRAAASNHAEALSALSRHLCNETGARYFAANGWLMNNREAIEAMYRLYDDIALAPPVED
jgi:hypothetical protein